MGLGKCFIAIALSLFLASMAYAAPGIPHQFYGTVTVNGNPADNASVVAKINGLEVANTLSVSGTYGFYPNIFYIDDPTSNRRGEEIEFFLNDSSVTTYTFDNGSSTQLDLYIGTAPFCGDGSCNANEDCGSCEQDCGTCTVIGPGGGGPEGSPDGGSASGGSLFLQIVGGCTGQAISVGAVNHKQNPVAQVEIDVRFNRKEVAKETTGADGNVLFTFDEVGNYRFRAQKGNLNSILYYLDLVDCETSGNEDTGTGGADEATAPAGNEGDEAGLCVDVDCDDTNPCTEDTCRAGICSYTHLDIALGEDKICQGGVVVLLPKENMPEATGPTGLFGLAGGQSLSWILVLILAIIGTASTAMKIYKKKK